MSLVERSLPLREEDQAAQKQQAAQSYTEQAPRPLEATYSPASETYEHGIFDAFYAEDDEDVMAPSPKASTSQKVPDIPALPPRSALRASKLLDSFDLKLAGPVAETIEIAQATPHDFYLSSEEDASSSADDFSDYDWDSGSDEPGSPVSRKSREDTARVVSVIYSGKPSIIDLSLIRRSISPSSGAARSRAPGSTESLAERPSTPSSLSPDVPPPRKSSMLDSILSKPKPNLNFLKIDPYANGSTYSLRPSARAAAFDEESPRTPRTPTAALQQGFSRTFSLVRKRSRPVLASLASAAKSRDALATEAPVAMPVDTPVSQDDETSTLSSVQTRESRSMTYGEIMQVVKRNINNVPHPPAPVTPITDAPPPVTPRTPTAAVKGLLGNLSARRRSIKGTAGLF